LKGHDWVQVGDDFDGEVAFAYSGRSVALSGDGRILAVGVPGNDSIGTDSDSGHVRIFKWKNDAWVKPGDDIDEVQPY
jgi:hypothetical protein